MFKTKLHFLVLLMFISTTSKTEAQWYSHLYIYISGSGCNSFNTAPGSIGPFNGSFSLMSGSVEINSVLLLDYQQKSVSINVSGNMGSWASTCGFSYPDITVNDDNSGNSIPFSKNDLFCSNCYVYVHGNATFNYYRKLNIFDDAIVDYSAEENLPIKINYLDEYTANNLSFQIGPYNSTNNTTAWEDRSFSILQKTSGTDGYIKFSDIFKDHQDWIGVELRIRLVQTINNEKYSSFEKPFIYKYPLSFPEPSIIKLPCKGLSNGEISINLSNSGTGYFDINICDTKGSAENCDNEKCFKDLINNTIIQKTGVSGVVPIDELAKKGYIIKVTKGYTSYPAYNYFELGENDLAFEATPNDINNSGFHVPRSGGDASVKLEISGGEPSYEYSTDGENSYTTIASLGNVDFIGVTGTGEVTKTIYVKDNNECKVSKEVTLKIPEALNFTVTPNSPSCHSSDIGVSNNGSLVVSINGGIPNYSIYLNNASTPHGTTNNGNYTISNLSPGDYNIKVIDYSDSNISSTQTIDPAPDLNAAAQISIENKCYNDLATITVTGSNGSYSTNQDGPFQTSNIFYMGPSQTSTFFIKSGECMTKSNSVTTPANPEDIYVDVKKHDESCEIANNGDVQLTVSKGTPASYGYNIIFGSSMPFQGYSFSKSLLNSGNYHYIITDDRHCNKEGDVSIGLTNQPIKINNNVISGSASCNNINDGSLSFSINPGERAFPPYAYSIVGPSVSNNTATLQSIDFTDLYSGTYELRVTDNAGCEALLPDIPLNIIANTLILSDSINTKSTCTESKTGSISITSKNGFPFIDGYDLSIFKQNDEVALESARNTSHTFTSLYPGNYIVNLKDSKGCIVKKKFTVQANPNPISIIFSDTVHQSCSEITNGQMRITASSIGPNNNNYGIESIYNGTLNVKTESNTILLFSALFCNTPLNN